MKKSLSDVTDMTFGSPYKLIFAFSIPLLIGNIFEQLYNLVDSIVVGNFIGEKALAAVGTAFPIVFMMSSLFMGVGVGATIMISQFYGAKDIANIQNTVNTIYSAMMVGTIPLSLIGILCSEPLLRLIRVPHDGTFEIAKIYLIVIFIGLIGNLGFNINAGILQGLGDSRTSLLFLVIATIMNIVLDFVFTLGLGWGAFGVAFATIISQISSWNFGTYFINKNFPLIHINPFKIRIDKELLKKAIKLGIPSGLQQAFFSIGILAIQGLVNSYGSAFMAGFNGANKIDTFAFMPILSFSIAVTTYVGQNVGASRLDRIKKGTKAGLVMSVGTSVVMCGIIYPLSSLMMKMFNQDINVINAGVYYLHSVLPFYFIMAVLFILNAVLKGAGEMFIPMLSTIVSLWFARVPCAYIIANIWGKEYIYYSYAVGWVIGVIISYVSYKMGKWKKKSIIVKKSDEQFSTTA